ncbi:hypothetical protein EKD16_20480 [Streptomonospora litoralis]|uniref:Uncharacterized protein n=1 Tax=Streptomonospora litoralis TaxID=2498135 RepID=A0A4P6Q555_9ACTN|nr:hypothetical protein EKD16_20480 [Streptomonospora litoralis]
MVVGGGGHRPRPPAAGGRTPGGAARSSAGPDAGRSAVLRPDRGHEMHVRAAVSASAPPRGATRASSFRDTRQHGVFCPPTPEFPVGPPPAAAAMAHEARRMARKRSRRRLFVHLVVAASADAVRKTGINPSKDRPIGGWGNRRRHRGATSDVSSPPGPSIRRTPGPCGHPRPRHTARPPACAGPAGTRRRLPVPAPAPAMSEVPESAAEVVAIAAEFPKNAAGSRHTGTIAAPPCDLTDTRAPPGSPASSPPPPHEPPASTRTDDRGPGHPPSSLRLSGEVRPTPGRPTRPPSKPEPPLRRPPPASTRPVGHGRHPTQSSPPLPTHRHRRSPLPRPRDPTRHRPRCPLLPINQPGARQRQGQGQVRVADPSRTARPPMEAGPTQRGAAAFDPRARSC